MAAAAEPEVSNDSDRTDQALDALIIAARETFIVLEGHVAVALERAVRTWEQSEQ